MKLQVVALGNSSVKEAVFSEGRLEKKNRCGVADWAGPLVEDNVATKILVSVNPPLAQKFASSLADFRPLAWADVRDLSTTYERPTELGTDRWVGALGAQSLFPQRDILFLDFGTALTLNILLKDGEFLGGFILPSLHLEAQALRLGTAQLPQVPLLNFRPLVVQNTAEAIGGGLFQMRLRALKSWIMDAKARWPDIFVVASGGEAALFEQEKIFDAMNEDLILWGAHEAFRRIKGI